MIITRTPLRISFLGGGTDYPVYYERKKGAVLGTTIDKYIHVSLNEMSPFFDYSIRISYSRTELVKTPKEVVHPSVRECLLYKDIQHPLDIHIFSDLPAKTGLGSSSSFTVGLLKALECLKKNEITPQELAQEACLIEQQKIPENVGSQDQFHAAFGGFNLITFEKDNIEVSSLNLSKERTLLLQENLLLFYTGQTRFASEVAKEQIELTASKRNDSYLDQMYEMTFRGKDILLSNAEDRFVEDFGSLLYESWLLKKQLSAQVSTPKVDRALETCLKNGAYGGKLLGAGSGGFLAVVAPKDQHKTICDSLQPMQRAEFQFEEDGAKVIYQK